MRTSWPGVWENFLLGEEARPEREEGADSDTAFLMTCLRFYPERIGGALWVVERFGSPHRA